MHFRMQNLNEVEGPQNAPNGHPFWHGRCWINLGSEDGSWPWIPRIAAEWVHGKIGFAIEALFDRDDREVTFHVAGPGFSYFVSTHIPAAVLDRLPWSFGRKEYSYQGGNRAIGLRIFDSAIWIDIWRDQHETSSKDPWWMERVFHPLDALLGRTKHEEILLSVGSVYVPMPERLYKGKATITLDTWKRPRWPFVSQRAKYVQLEVEGGIPVNGKGESGYDCGEDAIHSISVQASSPEEAIGKFVASVYRERRKHGVPHSIREEHKAAVNKLVELEEGDKL